MKRLFFLLLTVFSFYSCGGSGGGNASYTTYFGTFLSSYVKGIKVCVEGGGCTYTDKDGNFSLKSKVSSPKFFFYKDNVLIGSLAINKNSFVVTPFSFSSNKTVGDLLAKIIHGLAGDVNGTSSYIDLTDTVIVNSTSTNLSLSLENGKRVELNAVVRGTPISLKVNPSNSTVDFCNGTGCYPVSYRNWLVLVYMDADNNLNAYADSDLQEMESVKLMPGVKVIVLRDDLGNGGKIYDYDYSSQSFSVSSIPEPNMGDPNTLINFVKTYYFKYPASNVALIMWDHGDGWRSLDNLPLSRMVAFDESSNDYLFMHEFRDALNELKNEGVKINLIGFDECYMGSLEVFYDLKDYTDYVVASEISEPGPGWDYSLVLGKLNSNPSVDAYQFGKEIVDAYRETYQNGDSEYTATLISASQINRLVNDIQAVAGLFNGDTYDCFNYARRNTSLIAGSPGEIDLGAFLSNLNSCLSNAFVEDALNTLESLYKFTLPSNFSGVSIFFSNNTAYNYYFTDCRFPVTLDGESGNVIDDSYCNPFTETSWDEFLKEYYSY